MRRACVRRSGRSLKWVAFPARRGGRARARSATADKTLYSQLQDGEKARLRAWASMPTARRISDDRVKSWIAAGRP